MALQSWTRDLRRKLGNANVPGVSFTPDSVRAIQTAESIPDDTRRNGSSSTTSVPPSNSERTPASCSDDQCPLLRYFLLAGHAKAHHTATSRAPDQPSTSDLATLQESNTYTTLNPWQTRLVKLLDVDIDSGLLRVEIFPVELAAIEGVGITGTSEVVTYTALSHVWGTDSEQQRTAIVCNGHKVAVPYTLTKVLHYLLKQTSERYLWIDMLCINQTDNAEKAFQVRAMLQIFEKAKKVVAWVNGGALIAQYSTFDGNKCFREGHERRCIQAWEHLRTNLIKLANDELWSRTWCRQEIFAAKTLVLLGPDFTLTTLELGQFRSMLRQWVQSQAKDTLSGTYSLIKTQPRSSENKASPEIPATFTVMASHYRHAGTDNHSYRGPPSLARYTAHWLQHLHNGSAFRVSDQRDRVYGIFGMVSSPTTRTYVESRPDIKPDDFPISYTKTVSQVYQDLVKFLINTDRNLDSLIVFEDRFKSLSADLPSWVTDWRRDQPRSLLAVPPSRRADQKTYGVPQKQDLSDYGQLVLEGRVLFDIQEPTSALPSLENSATPSRSSETRSSKHVFGSRTQLDGLSPVIGTSYAHYNVSSKYTFDKAKVCVPQTTTLGDTVVLLKGARFPFVLRRLLKKDDDTYQLIGPALFDGPDKRVAGSLQECFPDIINLDGAVVWPKKHLRTFVII